MISLTTKIILAALFIGLSACGRSPGGAKPADVDYYTCTMHPSVRSERPGKCPICSMDLVPVKKKNTAPAVPQAGTASVVRPKPAEFVVPIERQQQIGVTYATVERTPLHHSIRAVGMVEPDLQRHWAFVARVDGYVQQAFVTSPGEPVEKDAPLLSIYSPDLVTTGREFVMLLHMRDEARTAEARRGPEQLIEAARARLRQWNLTDDQIAELERTRTPQETLNLRSPFRGVVEEVAAHQGVSVKIGDHLVDVADLSVVWVWADFYENELSMLQQGQKIEVRSKSYPGEKFDGRIAVMNPFIDPLKRTARVRIDIPNPEFKLRPGMYTTVELAMNMGLGLTIPTAAVMPTGTRSIVFVDRGAGKLEPRAVLLGQQYDDRFEVKSGLEAGERVVASANFLIDAEAKVQGALQDFEQPHVHTGLTKR
jgi:Cu(I)/Ag(I) efflux system membrane fusion protein